MTQGARSNSEQFKKNKMHEIIYLYRRVLLFGYIYARVINRFFQLDFLKRYDTVGTY